MGCDLPATPKLGRSISLAVAAHHPSLAEEARRKGSLLARNEALAESPRHEFDREEAIVSAALRSDNTWQQSNRRQDLQSFAYPTLHDESLEAFPTPSASSSSKTPNLPMPCRSPAPGCITGTRARKYFWDMAFRRWGYRYLNSQQLSVPCADLDVGLVP